MIRHCGVLSKSHIALRGNTHNVVVVKAPNDMFSEAIFIMRDEYMNLPENSTEELLRRARNAAVGYAASVSCGAGISRLIIGILSALLVLETVVIFLVMQ